MWFIRLFDLLEIVDYLSIDVFNYKSNAFSCDFSGQIGEAKNTFSVAVQRHDTLVKAWALWGDFVESQFTKSSPPDISLGVNAITCFLHACRHQNESKSRKYLAKVKQSYCNHRFSNFAIFLHNYHSFQPYLCMLPDVSHCYPSFFI